MPQKKVLVAAVVALVVLVALAAYVLYRPKPKSVTLTFVSTQLSPPTEQAFMRSLLSRFGNETGIKVDFVPLGYTDMVAKVEAEVNSGKVSTNIIGGLSSEVDYFASKGLVEDLSKFGSLPGRTFYPALEQASKMYGIKAMVPWMTATFVIVVNNKAFDYLPPGLTKDDVIKGTDKWTYDALLAWAKNIYEKTGKQAVGLPAGGGGLLHRFLHGYLYPSYTGYQAKAFNSPEAVELWKYLRELWKYTNPASTTYDAMADPLLKGDVWIAWDHVARVKAAITTSPDQFTVCPVPRGPKGRGYIVVLAGLAIPKGAPDQDSAWKLVEFLTRPEVQAKVAENVGFFPTVKEASPAITGPIKKLADGVSAQMAAPDSIAVMIPPLGAKAGSFNSVYRDAFTRIVLKGEDIQAVLADDAGKLDSIFKELKIPPP
ncbi:ABC transporter substrate-binding protein [Thermofilum pendens]|uniref:Extracellular solute-binding protein, family 1 n=1 Tax=Thermofilum pendens (strain DSM 2475 / Hrk 5) TaxID=368408 RepID=A1S0G6_THEPD|nr:extracellular solute-binding protein [Thermofilum pendens]ABL78946.1 extracellular solute-binding protein, family 1 [Thermofilum pendens Hrk 5]